MEKEILGKEFILEDVSQLGVKDYAFSPQEAEKYIDHLKSENILILGGDILLVEGNSIKFSYDNWYSDSKDYLETYRVAKEYLDTCVQRYSNKKYLVTVVARIN